jgi:hypothetical protein
VCFICFFLLLQYKNKYNNWAIIAGVIFFILKAFLILLNEELVFFEPKLAGDYALELYKIYNNGNKPEFEGIHFMYENFQLQTWINYIPFTIFGANRHVLLITNAFLTSLCPIFVYFVLSNYKNHRSGFWTYIYFNILPSVINFSIFGLRDPLVFFFVTINIISLYVLYQRFSFSYLCFVILSLVAIIDLRNEMLAFICLPYLWLFKNKIFKLYEKLKGFGTKFSFWFIVIIFFTIPGLLVISYLYQKVISNLGVIQFVSPAEIASTYAEMRYSRFEDEGGGSNILPPNLYYALPWSLRWLLQSLGIIILPFPWLIYSIAKLLAFIDSCFFLYFIFNFLKGYKNQGTFIRILFFTFIFGVLIMGIIVSNAGNAFRMRISIAPYILFMAGLQLKKNE